MFVAWLWMMSLLCCVTAEPLMSGFQLAFFSVSFIHLRITSDLKVKQENLLKKQL